MLNKLKIKYSHGPIRISRGRRRTNEGFSHVGFTIIEVITAIFVLAVGVVGVLTMISQTAAFTQVTSSRLTATYLAQEGIEIVKNIRDTNSLKIHNGLISEDHWTDGLIEAGCDFGCEADYTSNFLSSFTTPQKLKIDGGFYKYSASPSIIETPFSRKIIITPDADILKVSVEVSWSERGRDHKVTAQENLYKWW